MKSFIPGSITAVLVLTIGLFAGPHDAQWKKVDDAAQADLPQMAIAELKPIIAGALADQRYGEATKAIVRKIGYESQLEGNKPEEVIVRLQAAIATAPDPMKPVMEALLAHRYWNYFLQNRWLFLNRTRTAEAPGPDFKTWDLPRILAEIDRHFSAALAHQALLQQTPVTAFDDLLERGNVPDAYRPTLYDFLAHQALQFYQGGEHGAIQAADAFVLEADGPILGNPAEFMAWRPEAIEGNPPHLKAVRLHQELLRFHQDDVDRTAYLDADLGRLAFGFNAAVGETKLDRYRAALGEFIARTTDHEISARALALLAARWSEDPARAHALAEQGLNAFPRSIGATQCSDLLRQLEAKSAWLETEFVWNAPRPTLNVTYRNIRQIHFRAVPVKFEDHLRYIRWNVTHGERDAAVSLLQAPVALAWSADLPATDDYRTRTEHLPAPITLKPGFYVIIASGNPEFDDQDNHVSLAPVWVGDLALVTRADSVDGRTGGLVLRADTGEPVAGAQLRVWQKLAQGWTEGITGESDAAGRFTLPAKLGQFILVAEHNGHAVSTTASLYTGEPEEPGQSEARTFFFTDRAIYRPGQSIHYKGICAEAEQTKARVLSRKKVQVVLIDANGEVVARAAHVTNAYGSFSGVFPAPREGLTGEMSIETETGPEGGTHFAVEEYKRPKFEVRIETPVEAPMLGEPVDLPGRAQAYTGAAVGGATVKWRVERMTRLPFWCWWWQPPSSTAIADGTATTAADGTFRIRFTAKPDQSVPETIEPVFTYSIHADVTDATGETRSTHRVISAGYTALQAVLNTDDWQTPDKPVSFTITTSSLDGEPEAASGTLTIHALQQPAKVTRAPLATASRGWSVADREPPVDPANPDSWEPGALAATRSFNTDREGRTRTSVTLPAGIYRASLVTTDRFGRTVTARRTVELIDPGSPEYRVKAPDRFVMAQSSVEPGDKFTALWGTGYGSGRAFVEIVCNHQVLRSYWTAAGRTQERIEVPVTEAMRGGFTVRVTSVRENRAYLHAGVVDVPWSNKELSVRWERFRSKLAPGQPETWTATIRDHRSKKSTAEMVATLYDASLDQFIVQNWADSFGTFRRESATASGLFHNTVVAWDAYRDYRRPSSRQVPRRYRGFPADILNAWRRDFDFAVLVNEPAGGTVVIDENGEEILILSPFLVSAEEDQGYAAASTLAGTRLDTSLSDRGSAVGRQGAAPGGFEDWNTPGEPDAKAALDNVVARKNLRETAFFLPHVVTRRKGVAKFRFTMPETLTRWKFLGFAHDKQLRAGRLTGEAVTAKDLMVEPNPPRFVREGDTIEFTVKVSNQGDRPQTGRVRLTFADAATLTSADTALGNDRATEQAFDVPAKQSRTYSWRIAIPDGTGFLTYRAVGTTGELSDGEEGFLPVLSRRILVTESLPLPIRGRTTRDFEFKKLLGSDGSSTLQHQALTVQMTSQPAWYAVLALPYLMEFPHECSEQLLSRLYANALARHIAGSDPRIRRIFDQWRNTPALDSALLKNQDLKSVMIEETPWLRQAGRESESRRNVGLLFDAERLDAEVARTLQLLVERQAADGLWSWFPGGGSNEYISLYVMTGFGRLRHLGVEIDIAPALKALASLDASLNRRYGEIQRSPGVKTYIPGPFDALYLYGRSFFLPDRPVAPEHQVAFDYFLGQARKHWTQVGSRQSQAHLALALQRFGDRDTPAAIVKSLKERSVNTEELGMHWRDAGRGWWWYQAPIETQAMMIEAFAEVARDDQAVEDCKVWLLKQKQTQDWKTTKATADAVYGLLLRGDDLLSSDALVQVSLGGTAIRPERSEAGSGFYERKFVRDEIKPSQGRITVRKTDGGVSWGSAHWQYLEDMAKVTAHEDTPLKLKKSLWVRENSPQGRVLKPVTGPLAVGAELVVRLELRADRAMEFVHLKDQRGSGTEPVNVLSEYKYQDGLGYYESTRDTATHFFIDHLREGTYVFEYSTRVQLRGHYQSGVAEIQCMYAPEFNSHSGSVMIEVQ